MDEDLVGALKKALAEAVGRLRGLGDGTATPQLLMEVTSQRQQLEAIRLKAAARIEGFTPEETKASRGETQLALEILDMFREPKRKATKKAKTAKIANPVMFPEDAADFCLRCEGKTERPYGMCMACTGKHGSPNCVAQKHEKCKTCTCFCHHPSRYIKTDLKKKRGRGRPFTGGKE